MRKFTYASMLVMLMLLLVGCKEESNLSPIFKNFTINGFDNKGIVDVALGETLTMSGTFSGSLALDYYTIDISHSKGYEGQGYLNLSKEFTLEGMEQTDIQEFQIPPNLKAGLYHFSITIFDAEGSASQTLLYDIQVKHPDMSTITVLSPGQDAQFERGSSILMQGEIEDLKDLHEIIIIVEPVADEDGWIPNTGIIYKKQVSLDSYGDKSWNFNELASTNDIIELPLNAPIGQYQIYIESIDNDQHITVEKVKFNILP